MGNVLVCVQEGGGEGGGRGEESRENTQGLRKGAEKEEGREGGGRAEEGGEARDSLEVLT
jgi:hypothetical protein